MQSYAIMTTLLKNKTNETTPLLKNNEEVIQIEPPYQMNQPEPSALPQRKFLLHEIEACIKLLETSGKENLAQFTKERKKSYHSFIFRCMFFLLLGLSLLSSSGTVMILLMEHLYRLLIAALWQEQQNLSFYTNELQQLQKNDSLLHQEINDVKQQIFDQKDLWLTPFNNHDDNCRAWTDKNGKMVDVFTLFPGYHPRDMCYFPENNQVHPIASCNTIANETCHLNNQISLLYYEDNSLEGEMADVNSNIKFTNDQIHGIKNSLSHRQYIEPTSMATFLGISLLVIAGLVVLAYKCRKAHLAHAKKLKSAHQLKHCLNSPYDANRIINLVTRLGYSIDKKTTIESLLDRLKEEQKEIKNRIRMINLFFASQNKDVQDFLEQDTNLDVTRIIFDKAGYVRHKPTNS